MLKTKPKFNKSCKSSHYKINFILIYIAFFKKDFMYSFMRDREREAEIQAEGEAGSMQGAQCGIRSQDSRIMLLAEGRHSTAEPPRHPSYISSLGLNLSHEFFSCSFYLLYYSYF